MTTHRWRDIRNRSGRISQEQMASIESEVAEEVRYYRRLHDMVEALGGKVEVTGDKRLLREG